MTQTTNWNAGSTDYDKQKSEPSTASMQATVTDNVVKDATNPESGQGLGPTFRSIQDIFSNLETQSSISLSGSQYLETIRKHLEDPSVKYRFKTVPLNDPNNAWCLYNEENNAGIALIFMETMENESSDEARLSVFRRTRQSIANKISPSLQVLNVIAVYPEDYPHVNNMITDIYNTFLTSSVQQLQSTLNLCSESKFILNPNLQRVESYIRSVSPHAIPAYHQYGFTVEVLLPKTDNQRLYNSFQKNEYETKIIGAVLGRTLPIVTSGALLSMNPMMMGMNQKNILPLSIITDIVTPYKSLSLLPLLIAMAQSMFVSGNMWSSPYTNFGSGKESINIGNLFRDAEGRILNASSVTDAQQYLYNYFLEPQLAISVNEGRSRLSGIEWLSDPSMVKYAIVTMNNFLTKGLFRADADIAVQRFPEFSGNITVGGSIKDSRGIDFLRVVHDSPGDYAKAYPLLEIQADPSERANLIREFYPDYRVRYLAQNVVFNKSVLAALASEIIPNVTVAMDSFGINNGPASVGISGMLSQAQNPTIIPAFSGGTSGMNGFNTGTAGSGYTQYLGYNK